MQTFNSFSELATANGSPVYQPFTNTGTANVRTDVVTNNVLPGMEQELAAVEDAIKKAQRLAYSEENPEQAEIIGDLLVEAKKNVMEAMRVAKLY